VTLRGGWEDRDTTYLGIKAAANDTCEHGHYDLGSFRSRLRRRPLGHGSVGQTIPPTGRDAGIDRHVEKVSPMAKTTNSGRYGLYVTFVLANMVFVY
jgi:hypothetical protein